MSRLAKERHDLARAEQHIVEGERRISEQSALIDRLRQDGHGTSAAEALLREMRVTLDAWREHRDHILREIERVSDRD